MSFLKYSIQTGAVQIGLSGLGVVSGIINARWLGPAGVGMFVLLIMVSGFAYRFGNLGLGSALAFFVARQRMAVRRAVRLAWLIGLIMAVLACGGLLLFWRHRLSPWNDIPAGLFYLVLPTVPLFFVMNLLRRILNGQLRITVINLSAVINVLVFLPLLVIYVVVLDLGIVGAVYAYLIGEYATLLYLAVQFLHRPRAERGSADGPAVEEAGMLELWRYGRWSYLSILTDTFLGDLPVYFLKYFSTNQAVGFLSLGRNLAMKPRMVAEPFAKMLFPFTAASESKEAARRTCTLCRNVLPMMALLVLVLIAIAEPLITLLYGEAFRPAVRLFYALSPTVVFYPIIQFLGVHVAGSGDPKVVCLTGIVGIAAAVVMCLVLVPAYGAFGAALTISSVYALVAALRLAVYVRRTGARVSEVLIPQRSDWQLYRSTYAKIRRRMSRKAGA